MERHSTESLKLSLPNRSTLSGTTKKRIRMIKKVRIARGVWKFMSKQAVARATNALGGHKKPVLCIGDAGEWPWNDFILERVTSNGESFGERLLRESCAAPVFLIHT